MKIQRKPEWLQKKVPQAEQAAMRGLLKELKLNTVCQQALCPNISECFSCGQATFLILGRECTRHCSFCNLEKSVNLPPPDIEEPERVAEAVVRLELKHVVITSPTRDDLEDGGASHYSATVKTIRIRSPHTTVELLVPDFSGSVNSLKTVLDSTPGILSHNIETVPRLYTVRKGADYKRSLELIRQSKTFASEIPAKSGVMLGLGETMDELKEVMMDLLQAGCDFLSLGQYLAPSRKHHPVVEYIEPDKFEALKRDALMMGFRHVESGPYVRSSYHASEYR